MVVLGGSGVTDNIGDSYVVARLMTTKFPLAAVLMELVEQLAARESWLRLAWVPRQQNVEADALTNGCYDGFNPDLRIELDPKTIVWKVLDVMLEAGGGMVEELERLRLQKKALRQQVKAVKRKRRRLAEDGLRTRDPW